MLPSVELAHPSGRVHRQRATQRSWGVATLGAALMVAIALLAMSGRGGEPGSMGEKYQEQSLALYNPTYDLDSPTGEDATSHEGHSLQQAMADALRGAKRGNSGQHHSQQSSEQSLVIFNPTHDPDSPQEEAKLQQYAKMGGAIREKLTQKLKLREKVDLLASRQDLDNKNAEKRLARKQYSVLHDGAPQPGKPTLASLSDALRRGIAEGKDPTALISKIEARGKAWEKAERSSGKGRGGDSSDRLP